MYGVERAILFANLASYATHIAGCLHSLAFVLAVAVDYDFLPVRDKSYYIFRACLNAISTSCAFVVNDFGDSLVVYENSVEWTHINASAQSKTSERAALAPAIHYVGRFAILYSYIFIFFSRIVACSVANDMSNHLCAVFNNQSHDFSDFFSCLRSPYRASVDFGFALCNSIGKSVASRISASAAIGARKNFPYSNCLRIYFNCKLL